LEIQKKFTDLPFVLIDREDILRVLDNILLNAIYATPVGGKIVIATVKEYFDEIANVAIKVTDTGEGVAEDKLTIMFEPFFTTKPAGPEHGIGLGLSISRKIMEEHGGRIRVESKAGEGTTFTLFFPC
jgi:signal transduction histidine kinase